MATMRVGDQAIAAMRDWANRLGNIVVPIGEAAVLHIKERTLGGVDRHGAKFKPYSPKYARRKGVSEPQVNLYDSGEMLGNMQVLEGAGSRIDTGLGGGQIRGPVRGRTQALSDVSVSIGFTDPEQAIKAYAHVSGDYGRGPNKKRDFMGLEELWVQERVDHEVRRLGPPASTNEVIEVRAL